MKFLRMTNKTQSLKQASSQFTPFNDENRDPNSQNSELTKQTSISTSMQVEEPQLPKSEEAIYEEQILKFLITSVREANPSPNYFKTQPDISEHMRMVLLNWLIDVHLKYKLQPQTLFIAVNLIDEYLRNKVLYRKELQLLGITALWIAAKYEETYQVPKLSNLVYVCDSAYTESQILEMESRILSQMKFDFLKISSLTYFESLNRFTQLKSKDYFLGKYLLEAMLFKINMQKYSELTIATSVIFFIQKLRNYKISQEKKVCFISGLNQKQVRTCAKDLFYLWQKLTDIEETSSLKSKYLHKNFMEVAKIKMSEKSMDK